MLVNKLIISFKKDIGLLIVNLRQEGFIETCRRLVFRFSRVNLFYIYSLDLFGDIPVIRSDHNLETRELNFHELRTMRGGEQHLPSEFFRDMIGNEERVFITLYDGKPALIMWVSTKPSSNMFQLSQGEVELNYIYCFREMRRLGIYTYTLLRVVHQMAKDGFLRVRMAIHCENVAAIKVVERCGFKCSDKIKRLGVFKLHC